MSLFTCTVDDLKGNPHRDAIMEWCDKATVLEYGHSFTEHRCVTLRLLDESGKRLAVLREGGLDVDRTAYNYVSEHVTVDVAFPPEGLVVQ